MRPGPIKFISILTNDSYKGLDQMVKCEVNVIESDKPREEMQYDQSDIDAVKVEKQEDEEDTEDDSDPDRPESGEFED